MGGSTWKHPTHHSIKIVTQRKRMFFDLNFPNLSGNCYNQQSETSIAVKVPPKKEKS